MEFFSKEVLTTESLRFFVLDVCRAVLQVAFLHPGLWDQAQDDRDWRAVAGFLHHQR